MSRHDPKVTLQQLITYAQRAQLLCMNRTLEELLADWQTTWTFERVMQLLGEAVKRLPRELCNRYPEVDWKAIAGMRDNITHGYDSIDYETLESGADASAGVAGDVESDVERSQGTIKINGAPCAPYGYWNRCVSSGRRVARWAHTHPAPSERSEPVSQHNSG